MTATAAPQGDFRLKSYEFRREREASWRELEDLVRRVEKRGLARLSAEELQRLPTLYRGVLSSLSVARAISLDKNVIAYLEGLSGRAYFAIYCRKRELTATVWTFFARTFPASVRRIRWALLLAIGLMVVGAIAGYVLVSHDPERYFSFVPEDMAQGRTPDSSREELAQILTDGGGTGSELARFASFLFTHNARIGLVCFALGFAAGVPVMLLLFINGAILGAMWALYASHGLGMEFFSWVFPHGVTELLAVALCGAAGLSVGYGLIFPGRFRRLDNLAIRGRHAAAIAVGAVAMFFVAALLEGFFRQIVHDTDARLGMIALTAILWFVYFGFGGRGGPVSVHAIDEPDLLLGGALPPPDPSPSGAARRP